MKTGRANPGPLGLFGFALTTALLQGGVTTITEHSTAFLVYGYAFAFGGAAQALAGIFEFVRGSTLPAVAFVCYGAFWIGFAINGCLVASGMAPPQAPHGTQMMLALWGILTFFFFCAALTVNLCLQLLFFFLSIVFWLLAGGVYSPAADKAAGWIGLFVSGVAFYGGLAEMLNEMYRKTVLPLGPCSPGTALLPCFQRMVGAVPLLGRIYLRAVEREDRMAGYASPKPCATAAAALPGQHLPLALAHSLDKALSAQPGALDLNAQVPV